MGCPNCPGTFRASIKRKTVRELQHRTAVPTATDATQVQTTAPYSFRKAYRGATIALAAPERLLLKSALNASSGLNPLAILRAPACVALPRKAPRSGAKQADANGSRDGYGVCMARRATKSDEDANLGPLESVAWATS
jgi:hypothetical protein